MAVDLMLKFSLHISFISRNKVQRIHITYPMAVDLCLSLFRKTIKSSSRGDLKSSNPLLKR